MDKKEKIQIFFGALVVLLVFMWMLGWANRHSEAQDRAGEAYEACVWEQYGMHPVAWYQEHGAYPVCNAK